MGEFSIIHWLIIGLIAALAIRIWLPSAVGSVLMNFFFRAWFVIMGFVTLGFGIDQIEGNRMNSDKPSPIPLLLAIGTWLLSGIGIILSRNRFGSAPPPLPPAS